MAKSSNVIGIAAILLILAAREDSEPFIFFPAETDREKKVHIT